MEVLVIGDSISYGWGVEKETQGYVALLEKRLKQLYSSVIIRNQGISGDTILDGLARKEKGLTSFSPNYVLINFGTNDGLPSLWGGEVQVSLSLFKEKLTELVLYFQKNTKAQVLLLSTTLAEEKRIVDSLQAYNLVITQVAEERGVRLVDIFTPLKEKGATATLLGDGLHPNELGHWLIFQALEECMNF